MAGVVWRITDAKPGHEKQTLGLAQALGRYARIERHDLLAPSCTVALGQLARGRFPAGDGLPDPDLILGAGHATHLALLAARRARGGRIVCLMRPSLPIRLFDLCLIPAHDRPPRRANVIVTQGVLNAVVPSGRHDAAQGLILIGGVSSHYRWDSAAVAHQVLTVVRHTPHIRWRLTTSRRTPDDFIACVEADCPGNLRLYAATPPGWLELALAQAGTCWVSEDSVSMLYEALTAGCAVGLLRLPALRTGRVGAGVDFLISTGQVTPFDRWLPGAPLVPPPVRFNEAERCARQILDSGLLA